LNMSIPLPHLDNSRLLLYTYRMLARVYSCAVISLDGVIVEVEVDTAQGLPGMDIVSLPDAAVQESKQRVQAAIKNNGFEYSRKCIVVNLASASFRRGNAERLILEK
jgi:magnesium chelatase family protein